MPEGCLVRLEAFCLEDLAYMGERQSAQRDNAGDIVKQIQLKLQVRPAVPELIRRGFVRRRRAACQRADVKPIQRQVIITVE